MNLSRGWWSVLDAWREEITSEGVVVDGSGISSEMWSRSSTDGGKIEEIKGKGKEDSSVEDNLDGKRDVAWFLAGKEFSLNTTWWERYALLVTGSNNLYPA
jgi:hypothetical protein